MRIERIDLRRATTIHQTGFIDISTIENEDDCNLFMEEGVVLGNGSNIIIKNTKRRFYKLSQHFSYINLKDNMLVCGGAAKISSVINFLLEHSISSIEFLAGLPATIGGAVYMNAGAFGSTIFDKLAYIRVFNKDKGILDIKKKDLNFAYRTSNLADTIVIEAGFFYEKEDRQTVADSIKYFVKQRLEKAHLRKTFGSVFKNPPNQYAAKLIELSSCKGECCNTVCISNKHANFIVANDFADVDDILFLIDKAKNAVMKNFGVELEEEVKIV